MTLAVIALLAGFAVLIWSADRFVEGAASTARHFGMPPLLIGMVVIGFGTSAPELVVSIFAAAEGNAGIAVGNAYGSNIANIALILGVSAIIFPIKLKLATTSVSTPARGPKPKIFTKNMAIMTSWNVLVMPSMARPTR